MKCPYCNKEVKVFGIEKYYLMTDDDKVYDENLLQYICTNEHQFYGNNELDANADAEQMRYLKERK